MNQREFTRVSTVIPLDLTLGDRQTEGTTRDVSLNGCFVASTLQPPETTPCRVTLHIDGRGGAIQVAATGVIARSRPDGFAVQFVELLEVESYEHLRNLILYNATDPDQAEREFDSHLGMKRIDPAAAPPS